MLYEPRRRRTLSTSLPIRVVAPVLSSCQAVSHLRVSKGCRLATEADDQRRHPGVAWRVPVLAAVTGSEAVMSMPALTAGND
jgi:hypothetical protein